jgi:hypothetical protein
MNGVKGFKLIGEGVVKRQFNNAGPTVAADHYCLDPLKRINLEEILTLIAETVRLRLPVYVELVELIVSVMHGKLEERTGPRRTQVTPEDRGCLLSELEGESK